MKEIKQNYKTQIKELKANYKKSKAEIKSQRQEALREYNESIGKPLPKDPPRRSLLEEIGNSATHGAGSLFAIAAIILMLAHANTPEKFAGALVYSFGLFVMFTISCLYHSFKHGSVVKRLFRRFDYSSIYLLIGATFAPILLAYIGGTLGYVFFAVQWTIIAAGITIIAVFGPTRFRFVHIPMYLILGWSGLFLMPRMIASDPAFFGFIVAGGAIYSLGVIPFAIKVKVSHFIWHFFVLAGAVVQWVGIYLYIFLK